jgi:hypothetical protein
MFLGNYFEIVNWIEVAQDEIQWGRLACFCRGGDESSNSKTKSLEQLSE